MSSAAESTTPSSTTAGSTKPSVDPTITTTPSSSSTTQQQQPHVVPNHKPHSCVLCQQRKVRCDRANPCSNCVKARAECVPGVPIHPRRRKKRFPEAELLSRLKRYEEVLRGYGADIDAINEERLASSLSKTSISPTVPAQRTASISSRSENSPRDTSVRQAYGDGKAPPHENNLWAGLKNEFRDTDDLLPGSSDDEFAEDPITKFYDTLFKDEDGGLLFGAQRSDSDLANLHPAPVHIFRLWQIYLDNVNPITKLFHAPTVQQKILEAASDLSNIPKSFEALLFGIYALAIHSLRYGECEALFGEDHHVMLRKFQLGGQRSLSNAEFLRTSNLEILQALLLYLYSLRMTVDPRALFCLTALPIRIAHRMGLHKDGANLGLTPFEVEMRRRLWWQIVLFDTRTAEFSGSSTIVLSSYWNTKPPLNLNDSDFYPSMTEPPIEHVGATEMIFVRTRCEIGEVLRQLRAEIGIDGSLFEISSPKSQLDLAKVVDEFEERLETKYLKYCDPLVPLHFISAGMARQAICKMRLMVHHPRLLSERGVTMSEKDKELQFSWALKMLDIQNSIMSSGAPANFMWYIHMNNQLNAYVFLLSELRFRGTGPLVDRAWPAILEANKIWQSSTSTMAKLRVNNPLHITLANLAVKAWETREAANSQATFPTPEVIIGLREEVAQWKARHSGPFGSANTAGFGGGNDSAAFHQLQISPNEYSSSSVGGGGSGGGGGGDFATSMLDSVLPMDTNVSWTSLDDFISHFEMGPSQEMDLGLQQDYYGQ